MNEDRVRLMHYDPRWRQEFEQTRSSILHSCAGWVTAVEHIGSTAISGLIARPTIDVVAAVQDDTSIEQAACLIEGLNYGREIFVWLGVGGRSLLSSHDMRSSDNRILPTMCCWSCRVHRSGIASSGFATGCVRTAKLRYDSRKPRSLDGVAAQGDLVSYQAAKALFFAHLEDQIDAEQRPQ